MSPVVAERKNVRRAAVVGVIVAVSLLALYGWLMLRMARGPKIRWSARAVREGDEVVVTIRGENRFYWEVGGVSLLEARLDGQRAKSAAMPLVLGEFAPWRSKSTVLRFALPENAGAKRTLELVVTEKNRRGQGPVTHTIVVESQPAPEQEQP